MQTPELPVEQQSKPAPKKSVVTAAALTLTILILAAVAFALFRTRALNDEERQALLETGTFHQGISVNGIDLGGLTLAQAQELLAAEEARIAGETGITLTGAEEGDIRLTGTDLNISFNTQAVLEEALLLARDKKLVNLGADKELEDIRLNGRSFTIAHALDTAILPDLVGDIANRIQKEPVDASFLLRRNADEQADTADADRMVLPGPGEAEHPHFIFFNHVVGTTLRQEELLQALTQRLEAQDLSPLALPIDEIQPGVTLEQVQANLTLRGSYSTFYGKSPYNRKSRVFNMNKASEMIYGHILEPEAQFSANGVLGDRTYAAGWQPAPAIIEGGANTVDEPGGGVCQISSTLYVTVLQADLEIVYRRNHSAKLSYIPGGLDATISTVTGNIDFKFKNNTAAPLYIFMWLDTEEKRVHCEIYGAAFPDEFDRIEATSKCNEILSPGADKYVTNPQLPPGTIQLYTARKSGSFWTSYLNYYKGEDLVKTVKVTTSKYNAHPNVYHVGPGYVPGGGSPDQQQPDSNGVGF